MLKAYFLLFFWFRDAAIFLTALQYLIAPLPARAAELGLVSSDLSAHCAQFSNRVLWPAGWPPPLHPPPPFPLQIHSKLMEVCEKDIDIGDSNLVKALVTLLFDVELKWTSAHRSITKVAQDILKHCGRVRDVSSSLLWS